VPVEETVRVPALPVAASAGSKKPRRADIEMDGTAVVTLSLMQRACQSRQILFSAGYRELRARNLPRRKRQRQDSAAMGGLAPANSSVLQRFRGFAIWSFGCISLCRHGFSYGDRG
jgi:hypothetical protein